MHKSFYIIIITTIILVTSVFIIAKKTITSNEVIFWTLQMSDFSDYINAVINDYEKINPNVKIKWVDVPFSEGEKRTLASVLSDNPPDLINLNPDFSSTLANKGALYEIPKVKLSQFSDDVVNSTKNNDKFYSIPWYATSAVTIYNKELITKIPKTYEQIFEYAYDVKKTTGAYITLPNITENDTMLKILNKYGINSANALTTDKSIKVFELYRNLYNKNLIPKETVTITLQESLEKYMSGNIALINAGPNFLNMIRENAPITYQKTDVAEQIKGELGQNDFSLMNFVIPLKSKNKDNALDFALFLTNEKNQLELAKLTNVLVVNKNALKNEFYTSYRPDDLISKARVISAKQLNNVTPAFLTGKNQKEINNIINSSVQKILLNQGKVFDILKNAASEWNKINE